MKKQPKEIISARVTPNAYAGLKLAAEAEKRTISWLVASLVESAFGKPVSKRNARKRTA